MKQIILTLLIITMQSQSFSQENQKRNIEQVSNCTVLLHKQISPNKSSSGTGSIIAHNGKFFLVTASHVAKDMDSTTSIVFRLDNDQPLTLNLIDLIPAKIISWKHHSVEDISVIEIIPSEQTLLNRLKTYAFPSNLILNSLQRLPDDLKTTMMGYPVIDVDLKYFSPIYLHCGPASGYLTNYRGDTKTKATFLYLDKPSIQGMSGGPAYISIEIPMVMGMGKTLLVGIIHGTFNDNTGGKLAAISPASYVLELLN